MIEASLVVPRGPARQRRRIAQTVIATLAILAGLLSMHVLMSIGPDASGTSVTTQGHHAQVTSLVGDTVGMSPEPTHAAATVGIIGAADGLGHNMLEMICVLALLVTTVVLTVALGLACRDGLRAAVRVIAAELTRLAPIRAPSLHVLSISRT